MQVRAGDVLEVGVPHDADAELLGAALRHVAIVDLDVHHVVPHIVGREITAVGRRHEPFGIQQAHEGSQFFQLFEDDEPLIPDVTLIREIEIPVAPWF